VPLSPDMTPHVSVLQVPLSLDMKPVRLECPTHLTSKSYYPQMVVFLNLLVISVCVCSLLLCLRSSKIINVQKLLGPVFRIWIHVDQY